MWQKEELYALQYVKGNLEKSIRVYIDMYNAKEKGESVYQQFITERLEERSIYFFPLSQLTIVAQL